MDAIIDSYGLAAVCLVLFLKGAGLPIPVPGDLLLLAAAAQAASGRLALWEAFGTVLLAVVLGGVVQFLLVRGSGRQLLLRFGRYIGLTAARVETAAATVRRAGPVGVALFVLTPGVRTLAIPACGLALVPWRIFVPGLVVGSAVDVTLHFALGVAGGRLLTGLVPPSALPWAVLGILIVLAVVGLVGWRWLKRRTSRPQPLESVGVVPAWEQAACPACLVLGAALAPGRLPSGAASTRLTQMR
ncbi:MAG: VTT domain-containing protein [Chloroflexi bacterium]|nr:VTT domain-containing protein [Chloroflexota bacterium]